MPRGYGKLIVELVLYMDIMRTEYIREILYTGTMETQFYLGKRSFPLSFIEESYVAFHVAFYLVASFNEIKSLRSTSWHEINLTSNSRKSNAALNVVVSS